MNWFYLARKMEEFVEAGREGVGSRRANVKSNKILGFVKLGEFIDQIQN